MIDEKYKTLKTKFSPHAYFYWSHGDLRNYSYYFWHYVNIKTRGISTRLQRTITPFYRNIDRAVDDVIYSLLWMHLDNLMWK